MAMQVFAFTRVVKKPVSVGEREIFSDSVGHTLGEQAAAVYGEPGACGKVGIV